MKLDLSADGILLMNCTAADSDASILIEVLGTVLCKDMS
jgi:hypothetical protein